MQYLEYYTDYVPEDTVAALYSSYPRSGIYRTKAGLYYLANKEGMLSTYIGNSIALKELKEHKESSINEDFLLKVIAVTQSPVLATQLIKGTS